VDAMNKREAQRMGASDHYEGLPYNPPRTELAETQLMYTHGWRTGHTVCACPVAGEYGREVNGTHVNMTAA
jgi:hypothetical protein